MQELLILGVKRYGFTDKEDGRIIEGTKIEYLEGFDYPFDEANMKGVFALTMQAEYKLFDKFAELPAYYNVVVRKKPGKNGKAEEVAMDVKFSRPMLEKVK